MPVYKVEICGVNTSKLPLLSNEEKEELFRRILKGDREAREQYIKAEFKHGILKIFVPKKEAKPEVEQKKYIAIEG